MNTNVEQLIKKLLLLVDKIDNNTRVLVYKDDVSDDVKNVVDISLKTVYYGKVISQCEYDSLTSNEQNQVIRALVIDTF